MLLAVMMTMACAVPAFAASYPNKVGGYSVPATLTMQLGESKVLTVTSPSNGKYINVSFQTSNNIVKMSGYSAGSYWGKKAQIKFTGNKTGSFYSIATVEVFNKKGVPSSQIAEYKLYCKVTVTPKTVNVSRIKLNRSSLTLTEGESVKLTATISPSNATDKTVTWSSSNPSVVTVSNGTITAKKPGTAIITTRSSNGKKASCRVTVKKKIIPVTSVSLSQYSVSLTVGSTTTIYATVKPANATNKTVTWSSSNPSVATVSGGRITAKKPGTAKITAKSNNGKKATCTVKVTADNGKYLNVSDAYTILNTFRTTKSNQWYLSLIHI